MLTRVTLFVYLFCYLTYSLLESLAEINNVTQSWAGWTSEREFIISLSSSRAVFKASGFCYLTGPGSRIKVRFFYSVTS